MKTQLLRLPLQCCTYFFNQPKKNIDDYFQKLASRDYAFYAEEHQKEIGDLHKLLKELIRTIKQDLDIEHYVAGTSRCKGRLRKRN